MTAAAAPTLDRAALADLFAHLRGHGRALWVVVVLSLVGAGLAIVQPLFVQRLIDASGAGDALSGPVWALVAITTADTIVNAVRYYLLERTAEGVLLGVRRSLIGRLVTLPLAVIDRHRVGDLVARVGSDTTLLRSVITSGVFEVVSAVVMFVGAVVLMALLDPVLFGITLGVVTVGSVVVVGLALATRSASAEVQTAVGSMSAGLDRTLTAIRTVKAAGAEAHEAGLIDAAATDAHDAGMRLATVRSIIQPVMQMAIQVAVLIVLGVGGTRVASGLMELGQLMAFILYVFLLVMPMVTATSAFVQVQVGLAALDRIEQVRREPAETADEIDMADDPPAWDATAPAIELDHVSFAYGDEPVLREVSFVVDVGARVGIVGPSGAGKSTLLGMIERFHEPDEGRVLVRGVAAASIPRAQVREQLALVEQDAPVLSGSLAEDLRTTARGATDDDLRSMLASVGLSELAMRSDAGLDLDLGERGVTLSGGQRQRLAWARALLADRPILLLDEPTSAVDARTEELLNEALARSASERTVVVVAHRLATVVDFDRIVVLDEGRVVDVGRHAELFERCAVYHDMARRQGLDAATTRRAAPGAPPTP